MSVTILLLCIVYYILLLLTNTVGLPTLYGATVSFLGDFGAACKCPDLANSH